MFQTTNQGLFEDCVSKSTISGEMLGQFAPNRRARNMQLPVLQMGPWDLYMYWWFWNLKPTKKKQMAFVSSLTHQVIVSWPILVGYPCLLTFSLVRATWWTSIIFAGWYPIRWHPDSCLQNVQFVLSPHFNLCWVHSTFSFVKIHDFCWAHPSICFRHRLSPISHGMVRKKMNLLGVIQIYTVYFSMEPIGFWSIPTLEQGGEPATKLWQKHFFSGS